MDVSEHLTRLENGTVIETLLARATGFQDDKCGLALPTRIGRYNSLYLRNFCSPVRLRTGVSYWVSLAHPEFADEGNRCSQYVLAHPDLLRPEVAYISTAGDDRSCINPPTQMLAVDHTC